MANRLLVLFTVLALMVGTAAAQDARSVLQSAATAMGTNNLKSVQYSGTGWNAQFGQSYSPESDWPRFDVPSYTRTIDYDSRSSKEEFVRVSGNPPPRGGVPFQGEQRLNLMVSGNYAWAVQGTNANPQPAAAEVRQLDIWLTPHGFLKAALASDNARVVARTQGGRNFRIVSFTALGKYRVNGTITDENMVELVQTWVGNPVFGDMLYETRYTNYKDFGGVKFPTVLHSHQGDVRLNPGHNFQEVRVTNVQPNVSNAALTVPDNVRQATVQPIRVTPQKLADGVWYLLSGNQSSLLVEFRDFAAVVEAPNNDERSLAAIEETKKLLPNKPIRYLVNTHHHFDHAGGLRTFVAEGATIVTHERNREFFERVFFSPVPRTLQPDRLSLYPATPTFETVRQKYVISDGVRTLEVYFLPGLAHNENMLIAYLPKEKIVVQGDLYGPPGPNDPPGTPNANAKAFNEFVQRMKLDIATIAPIHGGRTAPWSEFTQFMSRAQ